MDEFKLDEFYRGQAIISKQLSELRLYLNALDRETTENESKHMAQAKKLLQLYESGRDKEFLEALNKMAGGLK